VVLCVLCVLCALRGLVGTKSRCQSAKKSAQKALKALKGSGGNGKRLRVRREMLRTKGGRVPKAIGDEPENARGMRGMRDKGPGGVEWLPCGRPGCRQGGEPGNSSFRCPVS